MIDKPTREMILAEPAGPRMDSWIAEFWKGMRFRKPTHGTCCTCQTCGWDYENCLCGWGENTEKAWELVDKFTERNWNWNLICNSDTKIYRFVLAAPGMPMEGVVAPTIELAIARAALLAVLEL